MMFAQDWKLDEAIAKKVFKKYDKDKDGELNMAELKVVVENFEFIDSGKRNSGSGQQAESRSPVPADDIPF